AVDHLSSDEAAERSNWLDSARLFLGSLISSYTDMKEQCDDQVRIARELEGTQQSVSKTQAPVGSVQESGKSMKEKKKKKKKK
ncbi:hypothetical protein LINGRAHAP2_LOCUS9276, partial [Linum grandiflorum]